MKSFLKKMIYNPVFQRECRSTFRGQSTFIRLAVYALLAFFCSNSMMNLFADLVDSSFDPGAIVQAYYYLLGFQMVFVYLAAPAISAGAISGEREKQTLDLMLITKLSKKELIWGKLLSSLLTVGMMIIVTIPIFAIIFCYGFINIFQFFETIVYTLINAMFISSIAVFFSSHFKKSTTATVATYLTIWICTGGAFFVITLSQLLIGRTVSSPLAEITSFFAVFFASFNPVVGFLNLVDSQLGLGFTEDILEDLFGFSKFGFVEIWHITALMYILLTILFVKLSANRINPVKRSKRYR